MADIFISYAREDRPRVEPLAKGLEDQGWSVWWDPRIRGGQHFDRVIEEALSKARCIVVIWSHKSIDSNWVRAEAAEGLERKILVPVIIEQNVKLPLQFRNIHAYELINWNRKRPSADFTKLLDDIKEIIGTPSASTQKPPLQQKIQNKIGMEFILIPSGSFTMGSNASSENEEPPHEVRISQSFYLQTTPVTQGQWEKVMGDNPSEFKDCGAGCPVEQVSWEDARKFIQKLNEKEGTDKYRLPTEAEWEYACRAGTTTEFSFGDDESQLEEYAWFNDNSQGKTHRVGTKKPSPWGIYDMHGNVWEWVEDDWHKDYNGAPDDGRAWIDEPRGAYRVMRGGSWGILARNCQSADRLSNWPDNRVSFAGFRLSRSVSLGS